ncbi:ABC transporter substrate-binding protein [Pseudomonadota bacterium]
MPTLLSLILLQAFFWVPSYDQQTAGNPERVTKFIEASIGDAKILNPILNADSASSRITDMVFDGLLNLNENLKLSGRLASSWIISEDVYLLVNKEANFPDGTPVSAQQLLTRLVRWSRNNENKDLVKSFKLLSPKTVKRTLPLAPGNEVEVTINYPERIQIQLRRVDQFFEDKLIAIIGKEYIESFAHEKFISTGSSPVVKQSGSRYPALLPVVEHNPIIRFQLRQNVRFHDGHEFDSGDVKFTFDSIMNPKNLSPITSSFEPIKFVNIVDRHTVDVVYKRLFSPAVNAWVVGILPEHLLNEQRLIEEAKRRNLSSESQSTFAMRDSEFNRNPVGTGPFAFVEWQSDEMIHLKGNDSYWEGAPIYKDYYYRILPDPLTQELEFRSGAVDTYSAQPLQVARYKKDDKYQSFSSLILGFTYIGYNNRKLLFKDKRVRRAMSMAINVDEIIEYVLYGEGERTTGPYPVNSEWYNSEVPRIQYDPEQALQILNSLGWEKNRQGLLEKDGNIFEFNLITNNGNLTRKAIMAIVQNAWRKIGIKCNTQLFEWAVFLEDFINTADFDAVVLGWGGMGADPDLFQIWHSSQAGKSQLNFVGYNSIKADDLIVRIRREYDHATQRQLAHKLHQLIAEDQPYTFLYVPRETRILDKKIVMVDEQGAYSPVRASQSGNVYYYFNRWEKLAYDPGF